METVSHSGVQTTLALGTQINTLNFSQEEAGSCTASRETGLLGFLQASKVTAANRGLCGFHSHLHAGGQSKKATQSGSDHSDQIWQSLSFLCGRRRLPQCPLRNPRRGWRPQQAGHLEQRKPIPYTHAGVQSGARVKTWHKTGLKKGCSASASSLPLIYHLFSTLH